MEELRFVNSCLSLGSHTYMGPDNLDSKLGMAAGGW